MGAAAPGNLRILVVDDDRFSRDLIREQLAVLGCVCDTAADGEAARKRLQEKLYDLMICDFRMPRIDGPTLARAIREREGQNRDRASAAARRLHIAIISANADIDHASECLAAGVDDFLAKPVAIDVMEALLARVALAVRGHVAGTTQTAASAAPRLPAADAVFDPAVLLRIYGAPHRAHAALSAWVANTEHDLARLSAALERRDMAAVRDIAHRMRGSASVAGAMQLAAAAADLERAAGQAGGPAVPALSELRAAFVAARSAANGFIRPLS